MQFVEEQAIDRVHRLNQIQDVKVYRLTVVGTVEERILALQEKKRELSKAAIDGGKAGAKLSMQDILQLFKPNATHHVDPQLDRTLAGVGAGLLESPSRSSSAAQGQAAVADAERERQRQREREKERAKFRTPSGEQTQYAAAFSRRW